MSQDRLELVIRPLAQKVMDLTLGRYQVLEHHRHKIPEFLSMCSGDVENILTALCNLDVERATSEARLLRQVQGTIAKKPDDARTIRDDADDADGDDGGALDARGRVLDASEEDARILALSPEAYIEELKTQVQRLRTSELYLRSTLSDVLHELDARTTALCTKDGQINHRNHRLAKQREAFLRENRQLRDIVAQFREKGKCDFPDPTLYDWDADSNADEQGSSSRTGGGGKSSANDPLQQLRAQLQEERDAMEKGFIKQLEEAKFKSRTLEAQAANAARVKMEQQQRITALEATIAAMNHAASFSVPSALEEATEAQSSSRDGDVAAAAVEEEGGSKASGTPVAEPIATPTPAAAVVACAEVGVQVDLLPQRSPIPGGQPGVGALSVSPCFAMEVDPALQTVLLARQPTPDGLGAGVARSVSTTAITPLTPGKKSNSCPEKTSTATANKAAKVGSGGRSVHKVPVRKSTSKGAMLAPPPSDMRVDGGGHSSAEWAESITDVPVRRPDDDEDSHRREDEPLGASPWSDDLRPAASTASALESSAHTPSQLEALKLLEEEHLQHRGDLLAAPGVSGGQSGKRGPSADKMQQELQKLRAENRALRDASGLGSGTTSRVLSCAAPHNTAILLARLKEELHNKSSLLEQRSAELDQLKMETMRWFDAYKRGIPPPNALPVGLLAPTKPLLHRANPTGGASETTDLIVNYGTAAKLKATVAAAEDAEQQYRIRSWTLLSHHLRGSIVMEAHLADMHRADRARNIPELCHLQEQLDRLDHQQRRVLVRLRTARAAARAEANVLWDKVLTLARGVCQIEDVDPSASGGTPRYYLRSPRKPLGGIETHVWHQTTGESNEMQPPSEGPTSAVGRGASEQHSVYFRAVSSAAAAYTVQHASGAAGAGGGAGGFANIPIRGVGAASLSHTLLPQRPQSAGAAPDSNHVTAGAMPARMRASVTRPQSALMLKHSAGTRHQQQSVTAASAQLPPPSALQGFDPCLQQATNSVGGPADRRAQVLAAMAKDKKLAAQDKLQLVEERRLLRASACATRDASKHPEPMIHMTRLVGKYE